MRCFLGIPCPQELRPELEEPRDRLESQAGLRPVKSENFHMTVKFLGDTTRSSLEDLDRVFQSRLPTPGPLTLKLRKVGVFPNVKSPSVAWAGIEPTEPLLELHETVESLAVEQGFDEENHDFTPHVTLGRFGDGSTESERVLEWMKNYENTEFGTFEATNLRLYESELSSDGPNYTEWVKWPL